MKKGKMLFGIYLTAFFMVLFVVIYIFSANQQHASHAQDQLELERHVSQGFQSSVRALSEENSQLQQTLEKREQEIVKLKEEKEQLRQQLPGYAENLEWYQQLQEAWEAGEKDECERLCKKIKPELLPQKEWEPLEKIKNELFNKEGEE